MAPRDMLAAASSEGGGAADWSWYVPVGLTALVIAVVPACIYFRKILLRWAPWLFMSGQAAVVVAAIAGVEEAEEMLRSRADRGPKTFGEFIGWVAGGALIMLILNARRRGHDGEAVGAPPDDGDWGDGGDGCDGGD